MAHRLLVLSSDRAMRPIFLAAVLSLRCVLAGSEQEVTPPPAPTATPAASPTPAPTRTPPALNLPSAKAEVERQRRRDSTFMSRAWLRGLEEIELSRIAAPKASNPNVHSLALRILDERGKADAALQQLAVSRSIDLPGSLEAPRRAEVDRISGLPLSEIDRAYVAALRRVHDSDVADSESQVDAGQDVELQAWVYDNLPLLEAQREDIHRLAGALGIPTENTR